jgi:diguanylate cyclase (GGDEF)-like protein
MPSSGEFHSERSENVTESQDAQHGSDARCGVTGLPNRKSLKLSLAAAVLSAGQSGSGPALIALRLHSLGRVERRLGPKARNEALCVLSDRVRELLKEGDLLGRTGPEDFLYLLKSAETMVSVERLVGRILEALRSPISIGGESIIVQGTVGVACYPEAGRDSEVLMRNSESALHIAQEQDAPYRFWCEGIGEEAEERRSLGRDLAEAIEHDQLELHFQPMVDAETGEVQGMEALARWLRPGHGWIPPLEFFAVAEECGVLESLEEWVLRRAASIHANWQRRGLSRGRLSINCVPSFLAQPSFADRVLSILDMQGLDGRSVEFEVDESSLGANATIRIESLEALRAHGMRVAIDDFRMVALRSEQLAAFPVDRLKMARDCVPNEEGKDDCDEVASRIIELGAELGLDVSGKGIEDAWQRDFLLSKGCRTMQGYLFARPMSPLEAAVLLRRGYIDL